MPTSTHSSRKVRLWMVDMRIALLVLAVALGITGPARADYFDGLRHWDKGLFDEAIDEWRSAAADGDRQAMLYLGRVYAAGDRVAQDYVEAHKWLSRAHEHGQPDANKELLALEARMTQQEISDARRLAAGRRLATTTSRSAPHRSGRLDAPPEKIQEAQRYLAMLGYQPGPADGRWNEAAQRAYQDFLIKAGMTPTPVLTVDGLSRLRAAAGGGARRAATARTPQNQLHAITLSGDIDGLQRLLASGVDVNQRSNDGQTALMLAVRKGFVLLVEHLLAARADPNVRAPTGATALYLAAENGHAEIAALLIDAGADPAIKGPKGRTPAKIAWEKTDGAVLQALGPAGAPNNVRVREARDLLYQLHYLDRSARTDWDEVEAGYVEWLVDHDRDQTEPLTPEQLNELKADLAELQERQAEQGCANLCAEQWLKTARAEDVVAELRDGADIKARNISGNTPLHLAVQHGNQPLGRLLLARGSTPDATNSRGETPLHWATRSPNSNESASLLLAHEANANARDSGGATPLHWAVQQSNAPGLVALLLDSGANIEARTDRGSTPLHAAVAHNANPEVIRLLLDRRAEVNAADSLRIIRSGNKERNTGKDTALHVAVRGTTNPETISLLLDRGADLEIRNAEGRRPRRIATSANRAVIDDWLRRHRKRVPRSDTAHEPLNTP